MMTIPPRCPEPDTGPKYWRSLDQLAETPEFRHWVEREFPEGASEFKDPVSRRHFVKIMSASFLLAGFGLAGMDLLHSARLLITLLFGIDIILVGLSIYKISRSLIFASLGALLLAVSDLHLGV